jgi:hypothetical protein
MQPLHHTPPLETPAALQAAPPAALPLTSSETTSSSFRCASRCARSRACGGGAASTKRSVGYRHAFNATLSRFTNTQLRALRRARFPQH